MSTDWMKDAQEACGGVCPDPAAHRLHTDGKHLYEACPHCGSDQPLAVPKQDDKVMFTAMKDPLGGDETPVRVRGTITREWGRPATDPYVSILTDDGHTFVRCISTVTVIQEGTS